MRSWQTDTGGGQEIVYNRKIQNEVGSITSIVRKKSIAFFLILDRLRHSTSTHTTGDFEYPVLFYFRQNFSINFLLIKYETIQITLTNTCFHSSSQYHNNILFLCLFIYFYRVLSFTRAGALKNLPWRMPTVFSESLNDNNQTVRNEIIYGYLFIGGKMKLATYLSIARAHNHLLSLHAILTSTPF